MADENEDLEQEDLETSPLGVSDEDFANFSLDDLDDEKTAEEEENAEKAEDDNNEEESDDGKEEMQEEEANEEDSEVDSDKKEDTDASDDSTDDSDTKEDDVDTKDNKDEETDSKTDETSDIDYKAEYERLTAPFRANNRDMQIDNVDDARTLMQMGANYNKKMAGLKPNLKLIKMLENNDLLDESKLTYLIDLEKKNPEAIKKLIKESGLDPLEIDIEGETGYKNTKTYTVNDKEVELDGILDDIQDTDSFNQTIDIISNKMDESSREVLLENPNIIKIINEHVATGIYEQISEVVEQERALGRLTGVTDLDAYKQVGDAMHDAGSFEAKPDNVEENTDTNTEKTSKKTSDPKLKDRKRAASSTKSVAGGKTKEQFNPLSMSDEDFEKASSDKFLL